MLCNLEAAKLILEAQTKLKDSSLAHAEVPFILDSWVDEQKESHIKSFI